MSKAKAATRTDTAGGPAERLDAQIEALGLVKQIESVGKVVYQIEVLPLSSAGREVIFRGT